MMSVAINYVYYKFSCMLKHRTIELNTLTVALDDDIFSYTPKYLSYHRLSTRPRLFFVLAKQQRFIYKKGGLLYFNIYANALMISRIRQKFFWLYVFTSYFRV